MRRLSSPLTSLYKRVFPAFWLLVLVVLTFRVAWQRPPDEMRTLVAFGLVAAIGLTVFLVRIRPLADEVWMDGDALLVVTRRHGRTRIPLRDVALVRAIVGSLSYVAVSLQGESSLGRSVTFLPLPQAAFFSSFRPHPIAAELMERVRAARTAAA